MGVILSNSQTLTIYVIYKWHCPQLWPVGKIPPYFRLVLSGSSELFKRWIGFWMKLEFMKKVIKNVKLLKRKEKILEVCQTKKKIWLWQKFWVQNLKMYFSFSMSQNCFPTSLLPSSYMQCIRKMGK